MSDKRTILIHLDTDEQPSAFDRVVAVDAGVDELFSYGGVRPEAVQGLVHGAIFTRGPKDLHRTAVFIGGSDVAAGEALLQEVNRHFLPKFGLQVSVMLDSNGANTTAAAAVRCAARHLDLAAATALVLGTGSVGQRVGRLLARQGAAVRFGTRRPERAEALCGDIRAAVPGAKLEVAKTATTDGLRHALTGCSVLVSAGPPQVTLASQEVWQGVAGLRVVVDLNAVPPTGVEGVAVHEQGQADDQGRHRYGAIGVGGLKMKVHKAALAKLFTAHNLTLDSVAVYAIAAGLP
jgi:hypothetical protein